MEGQLTIINLNECDKDLVKDREALGRFGKDLCKIINMIPYGEPIINRFGKGDLAHNRRECGLQWRWRRR